MEDVLEVYQRPYDPTRPVVCLDETSKQLQGTPRGTLPLQTGLTACQDYEYTRKGVCNVFLVIESLRGWRKVSVTERRTALDLADQLRILVDEDYADAEKIVLVTDNLNTHTLASLYQCFAPEEACRIASRIEWHYTPEHGSWLNIAECELSALARQCLKKRIPDKETLSQQAAAWQEERNKKMVKVDWHFTADDARTKLKQLYPVIKEQNSC